MMTNEVELMMEILSFVLVFFLKMMNFVSLFVHLQSVSLQKGKKIRKWKFVKVPNLFYSKEDEENISAFLDLFLNQRH